MSIEGTIGIILTVALGAASLYYAIRRKKYPKRMEFYVLDLVRIISPLVRKYESIKLLHNDQETKNVSFLRGMFLCVGDEDVELKSDNNSGGLQYIMNDEAKEVSAQISKVAALIAGLRNKRVGRNSE